jgi:aspartate aminotransferase-like enzyme
LRRERTANEAGESYFSSAVTHVRALDLVLEIFLKQGLGRVHERIQALSNATLACAREIGLESFPEVPSPSLSALRMPEGVDGQKLRADMEKTDAIVVMGGQDQLKGKIIRIGHMGAISDDDVIKTLTSLASSMNRLKAGTVNATQLEQGLAAARAILAKTPAVVLTPTQ